MGKMHFFLEKIGFVCLKCLFLHIRLKAKWGCRKPDRVGLFVKHNQ